MSGVKGRPRKHFPDEHGVLKCNQCDNLYSSSTALRYHTRMKHENGALYQLIKAKDRNQENLIECFKIYIDRSEHYMDEYVNKRRAQNQETRTMLDNISTLVKLSA